MGINPMKWKTRHVSYIVLSALVFYILLMYKKTHEISFEAVINDTDPIHVWEFVADFSNMKKLNPTIEDFDVIAESGNFYHWKYSVQYTEHLSHLPMIKNTAHGHFAVKPENGGYSINSTHNTCFFFDFGCLESVSSFRFEKTGNYDTRCIENVQYECPIVFSYLCYKEVMYQRQEIMHGLKTAFSSRNNNPN